MSATGYRLVLDNQIINVATIQSKIDDQGPASPNFELGAGSLESGAIPAFTARCRQASSIARSAQWARRWAPIQSAKGLVAGLVGLAAVVIIMLAYYKRSGVNAVLALALNTVYPRRRGWLISTPWPHASRHRRSHPDYRYGGRQQCADL